jgi:hypothetical protein
MGVLRWLGVDAVMQRRMALMGTLLDSLERRTHLCMIGTPLGRSVEGEHCSEETESGGIGADIIVMFPSKRMTAKSAPVTQSLSERVSGAALRLP